MVRILWVGPADAGLEPLAGYLARTPHVQLERSAALPAATDGIDVVLTAGSALPPEDVTVLSNLVLAGKGWLHVVDDTGPPPSVFGVGLEPLLPETELRVSWEDPGHPLAERLPRSFYAGRTRSALRPRDEDTTTVLYADWQYGRRPVMTVRPHGAGRAVCTTLGDLRHPVVQQLLYRWLRSLGGMLAQSPEVRVGILGYAPWLGQMHGSGVGETAGLTLGAVCDIAPPRRDQATLDFPGITVYDAPERLADDPDIDLVIVATPPNTHAALSMKLMTAGKHVVCEKPLALGRRETDRMVEVSEAMQVHLGCHQNRRWDPDYLAVREAVEGRLIGDLFQLETFVGGFHHPCGFWHSHSPVSGGTSWDWGAHYLDWIVSLMPHRVEAVIGTRHKRVWHDVTSADQERIQVRFEGGLEAEFIHSDIAAVRKPKWYALGTEGAIEGRWRDLVALRADPLVHYREDPIPATEMAPEMLLLRRQRDGQVTAMPMALPPREPFGFHRNLADHLLTGEPLVAPLEDSVKVVAILEAAARSMAKGGSVEVTGG
ncbi:MAG TPA: Gfo/Idh/MocA family oxidoreductase [Candidatus Limnocylindrales bacterium]|nr:Gfo/Idh/MocA family oxidoreductase [Candidatus Limnocylindrales bacterium]